MKLSLVINTTTKVKDLWPMFFGQIDKYISKDFFSNKYVFTDASNSDIPDDYKVLLYNKDDEYTDQFLDCINRVPEEYCVYISEDYILYDKVNENLIKKYQEILHEDNSLDFIKLLKGGVTSNFYGNYKQFDDLFFLSYQDPYFYTNQPTIWRTKKLKSIHYNSPTLDIAKFEYNATEVCKKLDIKGVHCYHQEAKRGEFHYDTIVFPYISTALVKGKWNYSEYPKELEEMFSTYKVDRFIRGVR